ncbi:MAG: site-2 protease family protein [Phycisphaerales bacterium]|nr:site-2 protease family protein [Phycisphaerales bacterium]
MANRRLARQPVRKLIQHMDFLSSGFNVVLIILGFGLLIFIHELGHFIAAKWAGIRTEAFAIGMGPVLLAWRKGIGLRVGSTAREYERRVREFLTSDDAHRGASVEAATSSSEVREAQGGVPQAEMYRIGDKLGLGETEYSLRILPIGGFVKMLGQEDANPNYVSNDPRSYTQCPVGKRMIVVSAGVIMNLLLAVILFIIAFLIGVRFEAPVIGDVSPGLPAGRAIAVNAHDLGLSSVGLQPADRVTQINDEPARTFADIEIASAMSKPGSVLRLTVERDGVASPLIFDIRPEKDPTTGLLAIGVTRGKSTRLWDRDEDSFITQTLAKSGLSGTGIELGMLMTRAAGADVQTYEQFQDRVERSDGQAIATEWRRGAESRLTAEKVVTVNVPVKPSFDVLRYPAGEGHELQNFELGLFGLTPLAEISEAPLGKNAAVLRKGDVVLKLDSIVGPRMADFRKEIGRRKGQDVQLTVLRDGEPLNVTATVDRKGKLNVLLGYVWHLPIIAQPMREVAIPDGAADDHTRAAPTAIADSSLEGGSRIVEVGNSPIGDWADLRRELRAATQQAKDEKTGASVSIRYSASLDGSGPQTAGLQLTANDVASLHDLTWQTDLSSAIFQPLQTTLTADGSPIKAIAMGFAETKKLVLMTYLTIDRLIRRSVGVDQLRGPVGIVHLGSKIVDRGFTYLIFFLAMISVNLAVINFLPMPIVDGGLFLFLIYEKFKGKPPPLAFQNAATVAGLCLIITMFVVVTWNDVVRLFG